MVGRRNALAIKRVGHAEKNLYRVAALPPNDALGRLIQLLEIEDADLAKEKRLRCLVRCLWHWDGSDWARLGTG